MGGWGSGGPASRRKCEHFLRLDIRALAAEGLLRPGCAFGWRWVCGDGPRDIALVAAADRLYLRYTLTAKGCDPKAYDYSVWIRQAPCRYGGTRPLVSCPRCGSRVLILYGFERDGRFGCRLCMRLAYKSECESRSDRLHRKRHKLLSKLTNSGGRPKWMRWRRYVQIRTELSCTEGLLASMLVRRFSDLLARK
jgi:hypothetical protein